MDATNRIISRLAEELAVRPQQVTATVDLLDGGATVPFVARYRKEVTGGLDDAQLRTLETWLAYLRELEARRAAILQSIDSQGKLTDELAAQIARVATKAELEDIYLPFKPKRRTKAEIARERGLEPLADALFTDRGLIPLTAAEQYLSEAMPDAKAALEGARDILAERFAEDAELIGKLRDHMERNAVLRAKVIDGKQDQGAKFADYFDHAEPWAKVPSHRALAMLRGRNEDVLTVELELDAEAEGRFKPAEEIGRAHV